MTEDNIVKWHKSYSVGISRIDEQHMELIKLTNRLFKNCLSSLDKSRNSFMETLHEAVNYMSYHFSTEELIMERINYPEYSDHKREHDFFVREVFNRAEDFKTGKFCTPLLFVYFLRDWVLNHIAVSDRKMGVYHVHAAKNGKVQNTDPEDEEGSGIAGAACG